LDLDAKCPALLAELTKALENKHLVQSAVFSECVYSQTLANMMGLTIFNNHSKNPDCLNSDLSKILETNNLKPRYVYMSPDKSRVLIQAGGNAGIDSALIGSDTGKLFTIEFKEPGAKTSEPDLPAYGENGNLVDDAGFLKRNPQFELMLQEQIKKGLNFWKVMGSNVNDFSNESIQVAVSENYTSKKFADTICVEDKYGYLTMIPANQADLWSQNQGEIRPAGRNSYKVWTPKALESFILDAGGTIVKGEVIMPAESMATASRRGGTVEVGRYKVNSVFYVKVQHVTNVQGWLYFSLDKVKQLKPTITAKMFFVNLMHSQVKAHYSPEL
jgi:hypothetical protein